MMKYQIRDSGILAPAKEPPEPPVSSWHEMKQKERMEAGFPKVIKVVVGGDVYRLYVEGDDVYTDSEDCKIGIKLISPLSTYLADNEYNWRCIEYEALC